MKKKDLRLKEFAVDLGYGLIGSFLMAVATYNFAYASKFALGGFSGICLIFFRLFGFPLGWTMVVLNIPLTILCYKLIGKRFLLKSFICMLFLSLMTDYIAPLFPLYHGDRILSAIIVGLLTGLGLALIYMRQCSTAGADFITMAVKTVHPHLPLGGITFVLESMVILASGIIFRDMDSIIYGLIIVYLTSIIIDKVIYGMNEAKLAFIITSHGTEICQLISDTVDRGSTILKGLGGYHQEKKDVVMVVCSPKEMYSIQQAVKNFDEQAFMIITTSKEVHGEGFKVL